jgi:TfoX/Sxy family transcriptional regulator of competence genes
VSYDEDLARRVRAALDTQPAVEEKRMFGGLTFMVGGQMCCGVLRDELVVRVGAERLDDALGQPHVRPMDFTGRRSTGMVYVTQDGLRTDQALAAWVQLGIDYIAAHPRTTRPGTRRPSRR